MGWMANPYQPPPEAAAGDIALGLTLRPQLNDAQTRWMIRALHWMRAGLVLMAIAVLAGVMEMALYPFGTRDVLRMIVVSGSVATSLMMIGLIFCSLVRPLRPRFLPRIALGLTVIGTTVCTFYFLTVIDRGIVGGLFRLFGASAFATLLCGLVATVWIVRRALQSEFPHAVIRICDLAVISYAVCGVCYSALALTLVANLDLFRVVLWISGIAAVGLHVFATDTAVRWWQRAK